MMIDTYLCAVHPRRTSCMTSSALDGSSSLDLMISHNHPLSGMGKKNSTHVGSGPCGVCDHSRALQHCCRNTNAWPPISSQCSVKFEGLELKFCTQSHRIQHRLHLRVYIAQKDVNHRLFNLSFILPQNTKIFGLVRSLYRRKDELSLTPTPTLIGVTKRTCIQSHQSGH